MISDSEYKVSIGTDKEISFAVSKDVFSPTGTTDSLIETAKICIKKPGKTLDLGCGCGVIGLALQKIGLVKPPLYASDLSREALDCTRRNASLYRCPIVAKCGRLLEPWKDEKFDYIIDDVSGVSQEIAKLSPWFDNVPCESGVDGTSLVAEVIKEAPKHLNRGGILIFPIVSFSDVNKILILANQKFSHLKQVVHKEWPLPKEMYEHISALRRLKGEGCAHFTEKFGMVLWFTDIYVAYNS